MDGDEQHLIVHVGGETDIERAPMLRSALRTAITQPGGPHEILIDLADLSFCDSAGLNALIHARQTATEHGRHIRLRHPQPRVLRLLEMTGTDALFPVTDT
ncbi:STAS domain-containing protein [Streptomyces xanthophaeus]|uniref:STAS domain-containing protein n=1 Tax=Streptomyces xanthophaeus TaxID=67385 RepID=UPI00367C32BE